MWCSYGTIARRPELEEQVSESLSSADAGSAYAVGAHNGQQWSLYQGDCRDVLPMLTPGSIDCVVTSPPYFWQRDYEVDGQIGMEVTIQGFVDNIVESMSAAPRCAEADWHGLPQPWRHLLQREGPPARQRRQAQAEKDVGAAGS